MMVGNIDDTDLGIKVGTKKQSLWKNVQTNVETQLEQMAIEKEIQEGTLELATKRLEEEDAR